MVEKLLWMTVAGAALGALCGGIMTAMEKRRKTQGRVLPYDWPYVHMDPTALEAMQQLLPFAIADRNCYVQIGNALNKIIELQCLISQEIQLQQQNRGNTSRHRGGLSTANTTAAAANNKSRSQRGTGGDKNNDTTNRGVVAVPAEPNRILYAFESFRCGKEIKAQLATWFDKIKAHNTEFMKRNYAPEKWYDMYDPYCSTGQEGDHGDDPHGNNNGDCLLAESEFKAWADRVMLIAQNYHWNISMDETALNTHRPPLRQQPRTLPQSAVAGTTTTTSSSTLPAASSQQQQTSAKSRAQPQPNGTAKVHPTKHKMSLLQNVMSKMMMGNNKK